ICFSFEIQTLSVAKTGTSPFLYSYNVTGHDGPVLSVHSLHSIAATGSSDMSAKIWDLRKLVCVRSINGHSGPVTSVLFGQTPDRLFTVSGKFVNVWDLRAFRRIQVLCSNGLASDDANASNLVKADSQPAYDMVIKQIDMSSSSDYLFTMSSSQIRIWDLRNYFAVGKMIPLRDSVNTEFCCFKACSSLERFSGDQVFVGCKDHSIKKYSLPAKNLCEVFEPELSFELFHKDEVKCFADNRGSLFTGGDDKQIVKWNVVSGHCVQQTTAAHKYGISALDVMPYPHDDVLLSACRGGYLKLWKSDGCEYIASTQAHTEPINCISSTADGLVLTASR
ncbi:unnamed protein product, partial [Soboliphyme baturini]|uniref:WD_REPEATS_REGION domain-containing protein n=1 Tax=Soboliphyme baturini TaxID=241478 RepID=A0A183J1G6_9BILA